MVYMFLMVAFGIWAWWVVRDQPRRHYAVIYLLAATACHYAETFFAVVFDLYDFRSFILPDAFADARLMEVTIGLGSHPLIAVLFAYYSRRSPVLAVLGGATGLALLEFWLHGMGAMQYHLWSPLLTFGAYVIWFLVLWPVATEAITIPPWLSVLTMSLWLSFITETFFNGALRLFHYRVPITGDPRVDSILFATFLSTAVIGPAVALRHLRAGPPGLVGDLALVLGLLLLVEWPMVAFGWKSYNGWNLWLAGARYAAIVWLTGVYARWLLRHPPTLRRHQGAR